MSPTDAYEWWAGLLDVAGSQPLGGKVRQCPAHPDRSPSLSVRRGRDGQAVIKCFSGCTLDEILTALRCSRLRLSTPPPVTPARYAEMTGLRVTFPPVILRGGSPATRGYRLEARHDYGRAVLYRWRSRSGAKELQWETRTPRGDVPGLIGIGLGDIELYREREVRQAVALGEPVLVVESESSVDALRGWYSTTWAGSATTVNVTRLAEVLGGHPATVIVPDNDPAGLRALRRMEAYGLARHVLMPAPGEDARDLYRRLGRERFAATVRAALTSTSNSGRGAAQTMTGATA